MVSKDADMTTALNKNKLTCARGMLFAGVVIEAIKAVTEHRARAAQRAPGA
jgi:hypothetical protein